MGIIALERQRPIRMVIYNHKIRLQDVLLSIFVKDQLEVKEEKK